MEEVSCDRKEGAYQMWVKELRLFSVINAGEVKWYKEGSDEKHHMLHKRRSIT